MFDILATGQFASRGLIKTSLTVIRISTSEAETVSTGPEIRAVLPGPLPVAGRLAPFADTGVSTSDAITATAFPVFVGTAPPYTVVLLYGRRFDHKEETLLGRTMATASGDWQLTVGPVPDGRYTIRVTGAVPDADPEPIYLYSENNPLVIDTVGLAVVKVERDSLMPGLRVYFQPDSGGFDLPTLQEATHYTIQGGKRFGLPLATAISAELEAPTANYVTVGLRFDPRGFPRRGALAINGIRDIAGNVLSGVFPMTTHAYPTRLRRFR